jgi:hypothetical protein
MRRRAAVASPANPAVSGRLVLSPTARMMFQDHEA